MDPNRFDFAILFGEPRLHYKHVCLKFIYIQN